MCVCPRDKLKTIAYICFCFACHVDWRKSRRSSHVKVMVTGQGHFSKGSKSTRLPIRGRG